MAAQLTSRIHTAVKIDPHYSGPVVHVLDASKSVPVAGELINEDLKKDFFRRVKNEYGDLRETHAKRKHIKNYLSLSEARRNHTKIAWNKTQASVPFFLGEKAFASYPLSEIRRYIDWTPFFQTWMLKGKYPGILEDEVVGAEAKRLFNDANVMLDELVASDSLKANAVVGFYPAASQGDDVLLYEDEHRSQSIGKFHFLRQQGKKGPGIPNLCLADFIASADDGVQDYLGAFAVTAGVRN